MSAARCAGLGTAADGYVLDVPRATWSYQVPPAGADSAGLEEYVVESAAGEPVGKVMTVLDRKGELFLAVECGLPPLRHELRAVPWSDVEDVDHGALRVRLGLDATAFEEALELDPGKRHEAEDADAVRVSRLPRELEPGPAAQPAGPVDRSTYALAVATGLLGVFSVLVLVIAATGTDFTWEWALVAVPLALLGISLVAAHRLFRRPTERTGRRKP